MREHSIRLRQQGRIDYREFKEKKETHHGKRKGHGNGNGRHKEDD